MLRYMLMMIGCLLFLHGCSSPTLKKLRIAAASDLQFVMPLLLESFKAIHGSITVEVVFGSTGNLENQIEQGADFQVFLAADTSHPQRLIEHGLAAESKPVVYAQGRLVIWTRTEANLKWPDDIHQLLTQTNVKKISLANPRHAPYGQAAMQTLESLSIAVSLQSKLITADNVAQAAMMAESASVDLGLIAWSLTFSERMKNKGRFALVPKTMHQPILQSCVTLKAAPPDAKVFCDFLTSKPAQDMLRNHGFSIPGEP